MAPQRRLVDTDTPTHLLPVLPTDQSQMRPGRYRSSRDDGVTFTIGAVREDDGQWYFLTDEEWLADDY